MGVFLESCLNLECDRSFNLEVIPLFAMSRYIAPRYIERLTNLVQINGVCRPISFFPYLALCCLPCHPVQLTAEENILHFILGVYQCIPNYISSFVNLSMCNQFEVHHFCQFCSASLVKLFSSKWYFPVMYNFNQTLISVSYLILTQVYFLNSPIILFISYYGRKFPNPWAFWWLSCYEMFVQSLAVNWVICHPCC